MTEHNPGPLPESQPWYPPAPVPAPPGRPPRRTALLVAGALVAAAALGGGGYALSGGGDGGGGPAALATHRPAPTATRAYGVTAGGTHYGDLGELLLPRPENLRPGPDFLQYGNDTVLDAAEAKQMAEGGDGGAKLSAKERKQADAALDAMHIKGAALRTLRGLGTGQVYTVTIVQVGNKPAAGTGPEAFRRLSEASDFFRTGPKIPGHPHAVCVLPDSDAGGDSDDGDDDSDEADWLDTMYCQATEGDLMVQFEATGPAPLQEDEAVQLVTKQLDRVQAPGEGV
ncbi:hypothetical protein [Streptomyces sp. IBSBF 2435]|uniref:hypothetical protein n=1 Tax=Streptomyces sp. IBSBF 2435 TaxID=2903531 RepID=UPI002FDBE5DA